MSNNLIITTWTNYPTGKIPKSSFCEHCARFNARNMTVSTLVLNQKNEILLIKRARNPQAGWWALVGGYVDWDETLEQCALRELKEEAQITADHATFFKAYDALDRDKDGRQNIDLAFVVQVPRDDFTAEKHEVAEARWFSLDDLPENIAFDHRLMIDDYKKTV
ncbi:MAG: NUDIX hydrolase [Patescibacteria group bacterium]